MQKAKSWAQTDRSKVCTQLERWQEVSTATIALEEIPFLTALSSDASRLGRLRSSCSVMVLWLIRKGWWISGLSLQERQPLHQQLGKLLRRHLQLQMNPYCQISPRLFPEECSHERIMKSYITNCILLVVQKDTILASRPYPSHTEAESYL